MIAHKTGPNFGINTNLGIILVAAMGLVFLALGLSRLFLAPAGSSSTQNGYSTYNNSPLHYSVGYPSSWQLAPVVPESFATTITSRTTVPEFSGGQSASGPFSANSNGNNFSKIDIIAYELDEPMSAVEFLEAKSSTVVNGTTSAIKVAGQDAVQVEVQTEAALGGHSQNLLYRNVFVTKGRYGYIIAGFAQPGVFSRILDSFEIN